MFQYNLITTPNDCLYQDNILIMADKTFFIASSGRVLLVLIKH